MSKEGDAASLKEVNNRYLAQVRTENINGTPQAIYLLYIGALDKLPYCLFYQFTPLALFDFKTLRVGHCWFVHLWSLLSLYSSKAKGFVLAFKPKTKLLTICNQGEIKLNVNFVICKVLEILLSRCLGGMFNSIFLFSPPNLCQDSG